MDSRTLWAIVLSMLVLLTFQFFFAKKPQAPAPERPKAPAVTNAAFANAAVAPAPSPAAVQPPAAEKTVTVETELYKASFSSRGAVPISWMLKKYKAGRKKEDNVVILREGMPRALALGWAGDWGGQRLNFSTEGRNISLSGSNPEASLIFEYASDGFVIRRTYTFHNESYRVDLRDEVTGLPDYMITLGPEFGVFQRDGTGVHVGPVLLSGMDRVEVKPKKLAGVKLYTEDVKWIAQEDKYFLSGLVPRTPMTEARAWPEKGYALVAFRAAGPGVHEFTLYAGPKEIESLKALGAGLEHIVDFGFFSVVARPILWLLKRIHALVDNWGWAIVLLSIVTRLPFVPLINKQQKSMKRLQEIQPKMQEIRQRLKKDPQRMQQEMMALYKKEKVNPMGGCLPLLIQLPVFLALYKVLLIAIELRGAPFMLWLSDLSAKDPYYVLPVLMGGTMFIQQKMTPSGGDPTQQKMMLFMPLILTFVFLSLPSGVVLYWVTSNLLSIAQQLYVTRKAKAAA